MFSATSFVEILIRSRKAITAERWNQFVVALNVLGYLVLLELTAQTALLLMITVAAIVVSGHLIATIFEYECVSLGSSFIIGAGLFVIAGQVVLLLKVPPDYAHWIAISGLLLLGSTLRKTQTALRPPLKPRYADQVMIALAVSLFVFSTRQPWLMYYAVPLIFLERAVQLKRLSSCLRALLVASVACGWISAYFARPDRWWYLYQTNDTAFFESIAWSISHWGLFDFSGFAGESMPGYHWFSYALFGAISHVSGLEPWDALMKIATPLLYFFLISAFGSARNVTSSWYRYSLTAVGVMSLQLGVFSSFGFSILAACAFISLHLASRTHTDRTKVVLVLALASFVLFLSKTSTAVVVALFLIAEIIFVAKNRRSSVISLVTLSTVSIFIFMALFRQKSSSDWLYFDVDALGELADNLARLLATPALVAQYILWITALWVAAAGARVALNRLAQVGAVLGIAVSFSFSQVADEWEYFGFAAISLATFLLVNYVTRTDENMGNPAISRTHYQGQFVVGLVALAIGLTFTTIAQRLNARIDVSRFTGDHLWLILESSAPLYLILCAIFIGICFAKNRLVRLISLTPLFTLFFLVGSSLTGYRTISSLGYERYTEPIEGAGYPSLKALPPTDMNALGVYIRAKTPPEAVLASNYFCCPGGEWLTSQLASGPVSQITSVYDLFELWGGVDYRLVATTRRRYLTQGNFHIGKYPTTEQMNRIQLSLDFANRPTVGSVSELKAKGITGYIVYLPNTNQRTWSDFAIERFRSGNFVYLEFQ